MSFKNKILTVLLSFTIIFSSFINSFAFSPATLPSPVIATVSTVAVAMGISLNNDSDIYNVARIFYDKYKDNQEIINETFKLGVSIAENKVVTVSKDFLNLMKGCFDIFKTTENEVAYGYNLALHDFNMKFSDINNTEIFITKKCKMVLNASRTDIINIHIYILENDNTWRLKLNTSNDLNYNGVMDYTNEIVKFRTIPGKDSWQFYVDSSNYSQRFSMSFRQINEWLENEEIIVMDPSINYNPGLLDRDKLDIFVPGNVSDLVGKSPSDVLVNGDYAPSYDLPLDGVVSLPNVSNPSIGATDDVFSPPYTDSLPGNPSIPGDTPFSSITDFIVSLVVPSDTFWTDTFNSFRDNFTSNFPMVDMSRFDELVVGGKPFPNIYAYDSKIVDGDVINSIVDWLRPIIAGFIMICLMFFNYRKVYKLIRNSEPFGNIAPGTSDFTTGLSSQDIKQIVADAKRETERRTYRR